MKQSRFIFGFLLMALLAAAPSAWPQADQPGAPQKSQAAEGTAPAAAAPRTEGEPAPSPAPPAPRTISGRVLDARTQKPLADAPVTLGATQVRTDPEGRFTIEGTGDTLKLRAPGYKRREIPLSELKEENPDLTLEPFKVRGLYLSCYGSASRNLRTAALEVLERNHLNALVIDIKGDRGFIPFKVDLPLAEECGAQKTILFKDYPAFIKSLKEKNLYLIARIVVFKDDPLASCKTQWAVRLKGGGIFFDRERLRWIDAFYTEAWDYYIRIAKIGAELGFDEIQFDYVRFPDSPKVQLSKPSTVESRTRAITGFLEAAYKALIPYNVFVAADVFGYVPWNTHDTDIGQQIVPITRAVDIVSLMVYPSGYHLGIPNYRNPVQHPYEIVYLTHKRALERTQASPLKFRPWLQAFRDYAFGGGDFTEERMRLQIKAAEDIGTSGFMFWNARNIYPTGVFYRGEGQKSADLSGPGPQAARD